MVEFFTSYKAAKAFFMNNVRATVLHCIEPDREYAVFNHSDLLESMK